MANPTSYMQGAHNFRIDSLAIHNSQGHTKTALEYLQDYIAVGGIHNSDERCDAPTCYPETRVAVQQDILGWITHGDEDADPMQLMWLSGPAGSGKTAIAGSVAEICQERDILAGSFFFSSYAPSAERSSKRYLVPTLLYQMLQHDGLEGMEQHVLRALQRDPAIFKKRLKDQFDALILKPFRKFKSQHTPALGSLPKVFLIDGVDEVKAEKNVDPSARIAPRLDEDDHLEIISCLLHAAKDPAFPFRVFVISRPERVFIDFFSTQALDRSKLLFLDEKYEPDSDVHLYLASKFSELRRRYRLSPSWPTKNAVAQLVKNASGQFIYPATVIRYVSDGTNPPVTQLDRVLELHPRAAGTNPFNPLHALYTHILLSNPNPRLAATWILAIKKVFDMPAWSCRLLLETEQGQGEHLLRPLASLICTPGPSEERKVPYRVYHKTLLDFLEDAEVCPASVYVDGRYEGNDPECQVFLNSRFLGLLIRKGPCAPISQSEKEEFLRSMVDNHLMDWGTSAAIAAGYPETKDSERRLCDWYWWASNAIERKEWSMALLQAVIMIAFHAKCPHGSCTWWCKDWTTDIAQACIGHGWKPSEDWLDRRYSHWGEYHRISHVVKDIKPS